MVIYWQRMTWINFIYLGLLHWLNLNIFQHLKVTKVRMCAMILFAPPHLSRCGSVVLDFMMRFNQTVVVSNVLIVLSDAARQDKFRGFKVNPDSIKQVLIPTDGSESTTKGKFYKDIVQCLHVFFRRWTVYNRIPYLFN